MTTTAASLTTKNDQDTTDEQQARLQLAAMYRVFDLLGWTELIYNHISLKVPGAENHFLINPYGLEYREVKASNLVKVDLEGNIVGHSEWPINPAGFVIHSAIHAARPEVVCIAHTHTDAGVAIACRRGGLKTENLYAALCCGRVAYHDFEGVTVRMDERERLVADLGDKDLLIMRHHGLLACGRSVAATFQNLWILQRACELQVAADGLGEPVLPLSPEVCGRSAEALDVMHAHLGYGELEFAAMVRRIDLVDPSWRE
jgi:ribulose-5-phosphate 4-epimerase/fuculose-1-phosphate aldolase